MKEAQKHVNAYLGNDDKRNQTCAVLHKKRRLMTRQPIGGEAIVVDDTEITEACGTPLAIHRIDTGVCHHCYAGKLPVGEQFVSETERLRAARALPKNRFENS